VSALDVKLPFAGVVVWFDPDAAYTKVGKIGGTGNGTFVNLSDNPTRSECVVATAPTATIGEHVATAPAWLDVTREHRFVGWPTTSTLWTDDSVEGWLRPDLEPQRPTLGEMGAAAAEAILEDPENKLSVTPEGKVIAANVVDGSDLEDIEVLLESIQGKTNLIGAASTRHTSPVNEDGTIDIVQGDDYLGGRALQFSMVGYAGPTLTEDDDVAFAVMSAKDYDANGVDAALLLTTTGTLSVTVNEGVTTVAISIPLTSEQTAALPSSPTDDKYNLVYHVLIVDSAGHYQTPFLGGMNVKRRIAVGVLP
jgi:hypothetical protein